MKNEFAMRGRNLNEIFPVSSLDEFFNKISQLPLGSYSSIDEHKKMGFIALCELLLKKYGPSFGISNIKPISILDSDVDFCGVDNENNPIAVRCIFHNVEREISANADDLSAFFVDAVLICEVSVDAPKNLVVLSNSDKVCDHTQNFPGVSQTTFVLKSQIKSLIDGNTEFWEEFQKELVIETDKNFIFTKITRRPHQNAAIIKMKNSLIGGQIIDPCGTGKTEIFCGYSVDKCIEYKNHPELFLQGSPNFLIQTPRLSLCSQTIRKIIKSNVVNGIDALYANFSSDGVYGDNEYLMNVLKTNNMADRKIISTLEEDIIKDIITDAKRLNLPLFCIGTYQSSYRLDNVFDEIFRDEAHNLIMGRFNKERIRHACCKQKAKNKIFSFTATPVHTSGKYSMSNEEFFGTVIHKDKDKEMIAVGEILPVGVYALNVKDYVCRKNKRKPATSDNLKEIDLETDPTAQAIILVKAVALNKQLNQEYSSNPQKLGVKILVVMNSEPNKETVLDTPELTSLRGKGVKILGISTAGGFYNNGITDKKSGWKDRFADTLRNLTYDEDALIINIDMIGEGLDNTQFTGVVPFGNLRDEKIRQVIGRPQRLNDDDRNRLYHDEWPNIATMSRIKTMIKPFSYVFLPCFDDNSTRKKINEFVSQMQESEAGLPAFTFTESTTKAIIESDIKPHELPLEKYDLFEVHHNLETNLEQWLIDNVTLKNI